MCERIVALSNERIHAVAVLVVVDGGLIYRPCQIVGPPGDPPILGVRSRTTAVSLFEGVLGAGNALDLEVTAGMVFLENRLDLQIDARPAADPRPRAQDAPAQSRERLERRGDMAVTSGLLTQREQRAPDPGDGEAFGRADGITVDGPDIARPVAAARRGAIPDKFPGGGVGLQPIAKVLVLPP